MVWGRTPIERISSLGSNPFGLTVFGIDLIGAAHGKPEILTHCATMPTDQPDVATTIAGFEDEGFVYLDGVGTKGDGIVAVELGVRYLEYLLSSRAQKCFVQAITALAESFDGKGGYTRLATSAVQRSAADGRKATVFVDTASKQLGAVYVGKRNLTPSVSLRISDGSLIGFADGENSVAVTMGGRELRNAILGQVSQAHDDVAIGGGRGVRISSVSRYTRNPAGTLFNAVAVGYDRNGRERGCYALTVRSEKVGVPQISLRKLGTVSDIEFGGLTTGACGRDFWQVAPNMVSLSLVSYAQGETKAFVGNPEKLQEGAGIDISPTLVGEIMGHLTQPLRTTA